MIDKLTALGKVLMIGSRDDGRFRSVVRFHEFGMSETLLTSREGSSVFVTLEHTETPFKASGIEMSVARELMKSVEEPPRKNIKYSFDGRSGVAKYTRRKLRTGSFDGFTAEMTATPVDLPDDAENRIFRMHSVHSALSACERSGLGIEMPILDQHAVIEILGGAHTSTVRFDHATAIELLSKYRACTTLAEAIAVTESVTKTTPQGEVVKIGE